MNAVNTQAMPELSPLGQLLREMIQSIVDVPEAVRVVEMSWNSTRRFEVRVDSTDTGKVLGKRGDTINAMRILVGLMGGGFDRDYDIRLVVPVNPPDEGVLEPSPPSRALDVEKLRGLLERMIRKIVELPLRAEVVLTPCTHLNVMEIKLNPANIRQVLGRHGRTIEALRQWVRAASGKLHRPIYLHVIDEALPEQREQLEVAP